jgi:electron transfer flavoprotein alpha subunit
MNILVFVDHLNGQYKKTTFETVSYASRVAKDNNGICIAVSLGKTGSTEKLAAFGAKRIIEIPYGGKFSANVYAGVLAEVANKLNADLIVVSHDLNGKAIAGLLAAKLGAGSVTGVVSMPEFVNGGMEVIKGVFSAKAYAKYRIISPRKLISIMPNAFPPVEEGGTATTEELSIDIPGDKIEVLSVERAEGKVPLPEADIVVSGGRGLKGPENWHILEDLATTLGAELACSRPVSDVEWRPHSEHVGQTGIVIRPKLYIAAGISGAIQHLAGVNNSKVIVVINKDPEAPFYRAADYGVVGDLFDVVPRLNEALKKYLK